MTRTEARKAARKLDRAGFRFVEIVEQFPEATCHVQVVNRCSMSRTVRDEFELADLIRTEGRDR